MASIPKISLGKSVEQRELMDLSHDNTTTAHWGFVQPLMCKEMVPNETLTVSVDSFVRLAPMVAPTMARATYNTYHQFVPMSTLWEPFEPFLAQTPYASQAGVAYVPTRVPYTTINELTRLVLREFAYCTIYSLTGASDDGYAFSYDSAVIVNNTVAATQQNKAAFPSFIGSGHDQANLTQSGSNKVSIDGCDFAKIYKDGSTWYLAAFKLNRQGRNLRQILLGLGYQLNFTDTTEVSVLPIIAFYKAYFDIFYVQRKFTWKDTNCAKLMMNMQSNATYKVPTYNTTMNSLYGIFTELKDCYYTESPDFVSIAQANVADLYTTQSIKFVDYQNSTNTAGVTTAGANFLPNISENTPFSQTRLDILDKLTKLVNKNTIIGGRIKDYLTTHYGAQFMDAHESNYVGSDSIKVEISDVMQTAETAQAKLGEYAGKGVGYGSGDNFKFNASTFGYYITLAVVIPKGSYYQGIDRNLCHNTRYDFFTPEFDAVGYQVMRANEVMSQNDVQSDNQLGYIDGNSSFGFVPRYTEYKVAKNICNGDISLRSTADSMMCYTLDKQITDTQVVVDTESGRTIDFPTNNNFVAGTNWRTVGKEPWRTNFNRIFVNVDESDDNEYVSTMDNFIVHNVLNVTSNAPMKSLSKSFDTWSEDDHDTVDVEKV